MGTLHYTGIDWNNHNQVTQPYTVLQNHTSEHLKEGIVFQSLSSGYFFKVFATESSVRVQIINESDSSLAFSRAYCTFTVADKYYTLQTGIKDFYNQTHEIKRRTLRTNPEALTELTARTLENAHFNLQAVQFVVNPMAHTIKVFQGMGLIS